jgi:hypothetical protein
MCRGVENELRRAIRACKPRRGIPRVERRVQERGRCSHGRCASEKSSALAEGAARLKGSAVAQARASERVQRTTRPQVKLDQRGDAATIPKCRISQGHCDERLSTNNGNVTPDNFEFVLAYL